MQLLNYSQYPRKNIALVRSFKLGRANAVLPNIFLADYRAISAVAQVTLKQGMSSPAVQQGFTGGWLEIVIAVASNLYVWLGLILYALGPVLWLGVLAKIDVSIAYPFVGLGFILTALFGVFLLGEAFSVIRFVGTCLVVLGIVLVTHGLLIMTRL